MGDNRDDYEKLFLLEVLVDNLNISNSNLNLNKDLVSNLTDTCVVFQFLHYPPLVVCESDFIGTPASRHDTSHITFKSGKSCFFALRTPKGPIRPVPFEVKVNVIRKLREGVLPDKLDIGITSIDISNEFTELLKTNTDDNCDALPLSRNKKGMFELRDSFGKTVGNLTAFIRLSCFGKLIITQFSMNKENEKSYLFKGTDANKLCQVRDDQNRPVFDELNKGNLKSEPSDWKLPGTGDKDYKIDSSSYKDMTRAVGSIGDQRRYDPNEVNSGLRDRDYKQRNSNGDDYGKTRRGYGETRACCGCPIDYYQSQPSSPPPPQRFEPPERGNQCCCMYPEPPQPPTPKFTTGGRGTLCDCPYPVPPSVISRYTQRTEKNLDLGPGQVGMQNDQVIFQLPLKKAGDALNEKDKAINSSVYYKLTSAEETKDGQQKNTVNIKSDDLPGMAGKDNAVSPLSGLPVDDKHDVFLLKIGKKMDGDKKRNLELELRTPKVKEAKPRMIDQDVQYSEADISKSDADKGKKGKKGKDDKGGKGKKGKKK